MRSLIVENLNKIKKAVPRVEDRVKIKVGFQGSKITLNGNELNEFIAEKIMRAIDFGFDVEDALLLRNEDYTFEIIDVKEHTNRTNLKDVRARVIGTGGKAKKTIEKLTGCILTIKDNKVGVIVDLEHSDSTTQAIQLLIQGSKHGNVFMYLEKQNAIRRNSDDDLGLRNEKDAQLIEDEDSIDIDNLDEDGNEKGKN